MTHNQARATKELLDRLSRAESDVVGLRRQLEESKAAEASAEVRVLALETDAACYRKLYRQVAEILGADSRSFSDVVLDLARFERQRLIELGVPFSALRGDES